MTDREQRIAEAQEVLRALNFDRERYNERSALVFLALLDLPPVRSWADATNPMIGVTPIMDWLRDLRQGLQTQHQRDCSSANTPPIC